LKTITNPKYKCINGRGGGIDQTVYGHTNCGSLGHPVPV